MVQTLGGNWWVWLVPIFLLCVAVMIPASRTELGVKKKGDVLRYNPADFKPSPIYVKNTDNDITEVIIAAAAAYVSDYANLGGKMKNLKITISGKTYDVTVEEESSYAYAPTIPERRGAAAPAEKPQIIADVPDKKTTSGNPGMPQVNLSVSGSGKKIEAPMSGRIVEITAPAGTTVKLGDTVLVMEAMKLQSEICAECDGVVTAIYVTEKQDVVTGDALALIG